MSYLPVPAASGSTLEGTRDQIRDNFTKIQTDFAINHVGFDITGEGKHKFVQMPEQSSAPTTAANESALYTKVGTNPAQTNLFFRGESNGKQYQLTHAIEASKDRFGTNSSYTISGKTINNAGWTFLPGGLIMQYGNFNPNTFTAVPFPITFPLAAWSVQLTGASDNNSTFRTGISRGTISTTGFTFEGTISSHWTPLYFIAIGN